jgi:hypothetical protein
VQTLHSFSGSLRVQPNPAIGQLVLEVADADIYWGSAGRPQVIEFHAMRVEGMSIDRVRVVGRAELAVAEQTFHRPHP